MRRLLLLLALLLPAPAAAQDMPPILSLRERARVQDAWLAERLETIVPRLMWDPLESTCRHASLSIL